MPVLAAAAVPHPPLIIPEVGRGKEKVIQSTIDSYQEAMEFIASYNPETIIIISPHAFFDFQSVHISPGTSASGSFADFGVPEVKISALYDSDLAKKIVDHADSCGIYINYDFEKDTSLDHGTMIPLHFLQKIRSDFKIIRVGIGGFSLITHYVVGKCIADVIGDKPVAIIGSGDLSHKLKHDGPYGFTPEGPVLDKTIVEIFAEGNLLELARINPSLIKKGAECGLPAFSIMAGVLGDADLDSELLSYEGPFGVGYAVATFKPNDKIEYPKGLNTENEDAWVSLARYSIENYVGKSTRAKVPDDLPSALTDTKAGVFVSIHKDGGLRGCIGTISPTTGSVAQEILRNAVAAASTDPRFHPVKKDELPFLEINVDVLGEPEKIDSISELDPKKYGVIVSSGYKRGLLLPDLEGIDTAEQQVDIARRKAGIEDFEPIRLERFEVIRHV